MSKFLHLQKLKLQHHEEIESKLSEIFHRGSYLFDRERKNFKMNLFKYIGYSNTIAFANGQDASRLIFKAFLELRNKNHSFINTL